MYMSSLENLKGLRRLDLCGSGIRELPQGIDTLTNLRYLDLTCPIEVIPDGILCKLSNLQYLKVNHGETYPIRVEEIASLRKLETLGASFRDLNDFNACVNSWKDGGPTDYLLAVRRDFDFGERMEYSNDTLGNAVYLYEDDASVGRGGVCSVMLPNCIKSLIIQQRNDVDVVTIFCDKRAFVLKNLAIESCGGIKQLLPCSCFSIPAFQRLESLYLHDLQNLSDLVEVKRSASSAVHTTTFSCLKDIYLMSCESIKRLFTLALLCNLQNLEVLEVSNCFNMVEIIEPSDELDPQETSSSITSTLPNLSRLSLNHLPELKIFCSNTNVDFPSLKHFFIELCPKLKRLPPLPPVPPGKEVAGTTFTMPKPNRFLPLPPVPPGKEAASTTFTMPKPNRFLPLPPLGSSNDVAGSTSTISLEGIEMDEKERAK